MTSLQTKTQYSYYNNASLVSRVQVAKGVAPLINLWNKKSENFFYDHRNLLDKYYFNSQYSSGSMNPTDNACFVIDPNAYQNRTEWQYVYNASMAREQKRMYYTPSGLLSDPATGAGGAYPWQYSLLDASNKETVIYQGFVNKDAMIKVKNASDVSNSTDEVLNSWEAYYHSEPFEMTNQYALLYPVEFNSSQYASWRVNNQGDWVKSYKVFDHLGSLRVEGIGVNNDLQSYYDYKPFGGLEASGTNQPFSKAKTRLGYVDMPKDKESNLGDHGVRKYDSEVGRFLAVDPLWEKYHTLNPFQYSRNSPIIKIDVDGQADKTYDLNGNYVGSTNVWSGLLETIHPDKFYLIDNQNVKHEANSWETISKKDEMGPAKDIVSDSKEIKSKIDAALALVGKHGLIGIGFLRPDIIAKESLSGDFNFKISLTLVGHLYEVNNKVYNANEFGNFLWGLGMASMKFGVFDTKMLGQLGTLYSSVHRFDEPNEQKAIQDGAEYYKLNY